jgi:hypothetical protein
MEILIWIVVFWAGATLGFILKGWLDYAFRDYSGTLVVNRDDLSHKVVYTLVLDEYPEKLEFKRVVILKVDTSEQSSDRK